MLMSKQNVTAQDISYYNVWRWLY